MKAFLKNYRQSPRKVRLVADLIKSKRVADAFVYLDTLPKRASLPVRTLLSSAVANAKQAGITPDNLFVENVTVDKGIVLKRIMPRARGSASRINKRSSHIMLTLVEKSSDAKKLKAKKVKDEKAQEEKEEPKKEEKKAVKKIKKTVKKAEK